MNGLLPPNSTSLERALEKVTTRLSAHPVQIGTLWNAATCPLSVLPWLASALSADDWDGTWPEEMKRDAVALALEIHRYKGTASAVMLELAAAGHPDAQLIERADCQLHNGEIMRDGIYRRGGPSQWATFRVILNRTITTDLAEQLVRRINRAKRLACHLTTFNYRRAAIRHNGSAMHDGTYHRALI